MAEYRIRFVADTSAAGRSISDIQKAIKAVTKEFEKAEIGADGFREAASDLSKLKKELTDARNAVTNIDRAYQSLNKAIDANFTAANKASKAAEDYNKKLLNLANEQLQAEDQARRKNFQAEVDDWDKRFNLAVTQSKKIAAQQRGVMEFRAGMGARGAIPEIASPIRGSANQFGSPVYFDALEKSLKQAVNTSGEIGPKPEAFSPYSLAAYESKLKALKNEARLIAPETSRWRELAKEIVKTEKAVENIKRRQSAGPSGQARLGAAGGAFLYGGGLGGGVGSALGGITGGLMGGVPGAFTGAAVGQAVDGVIAMGAGAAKSAADIAQLQRGLALASIDANDFAAAQQAIAQSSNTLAIPLEQVYRQFTQLRVNTKEYGMSIKETQEIFEGVVLAVSSVGGSMEDVDGAMRAVVQIFSKGKVQAEELRGQLGERFPGAVVKFAQANKLSFEELQVALEQGKVTVADFVEFAKKNYQDYSKFSEQIATAPEFAGRRLEKAMSDMQIAIGSALGPAGAAFQDFATEAIKSITDFVTQNKGLIIQVGKDFSVVFSGIVNAASMMGQMIMKVLGPVYQYIGEVINRLRIMTGTATASSARAEMDAAFALMKKHGTGRTRFQQGGIGYMSDKIEYDKAAARYAAAEKQFKATGGSAAMASLTTPQNLTFGGPGAGIKLDALSGDKPGKEKKTRLTDYSSKMIEVLRARLKEEKLAIETSDKLSARQKELDIASKEYEYGLRIIEEQLKQVREEKSKMSAADAKLAMAEANQTAVSERSSLKHEYNKAVLGDLFGITEDYEKQIQRVTLEINALNTAEGEITKTQEAELALLEQLKGVKEEDIPLIEARKNRIMELAGELDRLLSIEKEVRKEQELRQSLETKRTEMGMIGAGLRAGFTGEAASAFESAMLESKGNVDYASQMATLETQAMQLRAVFESIQGAINSVSGAFANMLTEGITSMITGTATAKEVFASFLQSVGQALSQAASQMIATYIAIGIAKLFAGLGGGGGNPAGSGGGISNSLPGIRQYAGGLGGGGAPGSMPFAPPAFANGGIVTGPTLSLIGEGKYNEAVVPLPDGRSIPVQLGGRSARDMMGGNAPGMPQAPSLSMKFETTKINGVEYVSREQLEQAMAETRRASIAGGAQRGMSMTLDKIKQSPSTRSSIGIR